MTKSGEKNYLRAWREYRGMTQVELARRAGTTGPVISLLESGARGLSDKWLRKLSPILNTRPGHLLEVDPNALGDDINDIWVTIPDDAKPQAREILLTFAAKPRRVF